MTSSPALPIMPSFSDFFLALWPQCKEHGPFPWQSMLAERVAEGSWPQAIDLPTAAGKTACIDAAIYALAAQAERPLAKRTAPRRIWFVVDRRIVVDEAFDRASAIASKLKEAKDGPLKAVADRLLGLSGLREDARPLAAARLHGGILRGDNWGRIPSQPAVITSTVDQLGSRLLFRGYGHRNLTASIFAGLAANDSLILLDEAHCSVPFMQTLQAIATFRGEAWAEQPIVTPFAFAILSATPPGDIARDAVFPGADRERVLDHPVLRKRLSAKKPAELRTVPTKGKVKADDADPLVTEAVNQVIVYRKNGKRRVAVIVNRVHTARLIAEALSKAAGDTANVVLLTGRIRPYERDRLVARWQAFLKAGAAREPEKPVILVSTQCIEVGADFSFDALVTEAASLDALRQRFGRLNRMGDPGEAPATILVRERDLKEAQPDDPIYGSAIRACWTLLDGKAKVGEGGGNRIDFGFDALDEALRDADNLADCLAPRPDAPILLPAHLDLLCQTAPAPAVQPDIGLYLHGKERGAPEARVVWRADFFSDKTHLWKETVALCPPASGEMLSVPLHRLRAWLAGGRGAGEDGAGDVEGAPTPREEEGALAGRGRPFLLWRGRDRSQVSDRPQEVKPDDVIIVPAAYSMADLGQSEADKGLSEGFGADGLDLWEVCRKASGKPAALRVNGASLKRWEACPPVKALIDLAEEEECDRDAFRGALAAVREYQPTSEDGRKAAPDWLCDLIDDVGDGRIEEHPAGGVVMFARRGRSVPEPDLFADDDDSASAIVVEAGEAVSLALHTRSVETAVGRIAGGCLPPELLEPLLRSATWHDVGKLDERFQHMLQQGTDLSGEPAVLAKSATMPASAEQWEAARAAAGLPKGFRHEMLSLQLAERYAGLGEGEEDLVLHLIASHHGHARPFAPVVVEDREPPPVLGHHAGVAVALDTGERGSLPQPHAIASGVADRFWRLNRRYGWWGLAYLEGVLRLGDWYGSAVVVPGDPAQDPPVLASGARSKVAPPPAAQSDPIVLTGLDGANPLGFLAALGTLAVLNRGACPQARLAWKRTGATWRPVLSGVGFENEGALCGTIAAALRGREVTEEAERRRKEKEQEFLASRTEARDKRSEIRDRGVRGKERKAVIEKELLPLEQQVLQKRSAWLDALRAAVPRPELALGQRVDCSEEEYRGHAIGFLQNGRHTTREPLDFLCAFASDGCLDGKNRHVVATPFCFVTGSGHQFFLDTVRSLMGNVAADRIRLALFCPWTYGDERLSLRWDPTEDRRYALMDGAPTDVASRTVWMANLLAYRALSLFPSAPARSRLKTAGWSGQAELFTWPIWESPAAADTIRSLILLPGLGAERPERRDLKELGIPALFRARRVKVGSGANYKLNFSPAQSV